MDKGDVVRVKGDPVVGRPGVVVKVDRKRKVAAVDFGYGKPVGYAFWALRKVAR